MIDGRLENYRQILMKSLSDNELHPNNVISLNIDKNINPVVEPLHRIFKFQHIQQEKFKDLIDVLSKITNISDLLSLKMNS